MRKPKGVFLIIKEFCGTTKQMEIFRQIRAKEKRKENIGRSNNFLVTHLNTMVVVNKKIVAQK